MALLCASIASCAVMAAAPGRALAQTAMTYSIPGGPLDGALARFGVASGIQVLYDSALARGISTKGASGTLPPEQALGRILSGTGLTYRFTAANRVTIAAASAASTAPPTNGATVLDTITVSGKSGRSTAETPYETAAPAAHIAQENIERFRGSSPADIFRGTAGVMSGEARNGAGAVDVNIRGMQGMGRVTTTVDGAENNVTIYQGYQGLSNRTYIDPDFIAGADIIKGSDASSFGNAGSVAMRTLSADDIVKDGNKWGVRVKGGFGTNTSSPVPGKRAGYLFNNPLSELGDPNGRSGSATPSATGMNRPGSFTPTSGSGSIVGAYKGESADILAGYARRRQGNYHAGKNGDSANPVNTGTRPFCYPNGQCLFEYRDYTANGGLVNYRGGEEVLNTQLETESWMGKITARLNDDHTLQLGYTGFRSEAGDRMASNLASTMTQATQQKQTTGIRLDTFTARHRWNPESDLIDMTADFYWTHFQQHNPIRLGYASPGAIGLPANFRVGANTDMWGANITNRSNFSLSHGDLDLSYGLSYRGEDTRASPYSEVLESFIPMRDAIRHEAAGFAKAAYTPDRWDWLTLNAGLRYSHFWSEDRGDNFQRLLANNGSVIPGFTTDSGGFSPSAGITIEPVDGAQFYLNYSNTMRAPSIIESVSAFVGLTANSQVTPERSSNWEIGTNLTRDGLFTDNDRGMLKFGYFNWDVKDYISRNMIVDSTGNSKLSIGNINRARFSGLELSGRYETGGFTADVSANYFLDVEYCRTADSCDSKSLYGDYATNHVQPEYTVSLTLSQKLLEDRLTLGGRVSHIGPRAIGHGDVTAVGAQQFIAPILWKPHTLVDLFGEYKVSDNLTASIRVENLFDRFYVDPLGLVAQPGPGRTFYASLTSNFGGEQSLPGFSSGLDDDAQEGRVDWSGLYAGFHTGSNFSSISGSTTSLDGTENAIAATESANLNLNSGLVGLQAGYNWQSGERTVLGLDSGWSKTWLQGKQKAVSTEGTLAENGAFQARTFYEVDWTAALRAKAGYAINNRLLAYGTGGLALARETQSREQFSASNNMSYTLGTETAIASTETKSATRVGFTAGGGVEYAINDRWSVNADYAFSYFGKTSFDFDTARAGAGKAYTEQKQVGVNIIPPLAPDHTLCTRPVPSPRCSEMQVPVYEYINHPGKFDTTNGRKAKNSFTLHSFKVGLNYRF